MPTGTEHIERSHARHVLGVAPRRARLLTIVLAALVVAVLILDLGIIGFLAGLALAALPVPLYVALALWLDRFEAEPGTVLLRAFLWGAVVAIVVSLLANRMAFTLLAGAFGAGAGDLLSGVLAAPAIEETAKGIALLLLFLHHDDEFDNVTDGVVYAAMIGLGFAMTENALYYGRVWDTEALSSVFVLRGVIGPFAHPLFTAMTGVGIGIARERHGHDGSWIAPAVGFALAVLLHALWNAAASAHVLFPTTYLVIMVPAFLAALFTVRRSGRREVDVLRTHLAHLVEDETTFDGAQLDGLCTQRGRIRALIRAYRSDGLKGLRAQRRFHDAVTHLAFQDWRMAHGIDEGDAGARRAAAYRVRVRRHLGAMSGATPPSVANATSADSATLPG